MSGCVCTLQIDRIQPSYPQQIFSAGKLGSFTKDACHVRKYCTCPIWKKLLFLCGAWTWKRPDLLAPVQVLQQRLGDQLHRAQGSVPWQFWNDRITSGIDQTYVYSAHIHTYTFVIHVRFCMRLSDPHRILSQVLHVLRLKETPFSAVPGLETVRHLSRLKCKVMEISFRGRKDLNGTLSQGFKGLKDLQKLDLSDTKISGDLSVLANCTEMTHLKLRNTLVSGNLAALAEASIEFLDLSNSKVTGNLGALKGAELWRVHLSNTRIAGDVAVLGTWRYTKEVDLSDTDVTGAFHVKVLKGLEILKLTGTRTKIDFMGGRIRPCPFPTMTTLEVSGLAMDASVSEFLAPLLHCRHLNSIGAAGCGLTGEVPKTVLFGLREFPFDETELGRALVFLDLASNHIDKVDSIPERLKSLVLAGNRNMSFAEGVLQKAVQDGILLDMQNVTFTNQIDAHRCRAWFDCKVMWTAVKI